MPSQCHLDLNLEFVGAATAYTAQPQLILWCKPIFTSNPTELGKVMLRLELSWGCDNNILLLKNFLHHQTNLNHTYQTKPNQTKPGLYAPIFMFRCIATPNSSVDLSFAIPMPPEPKFRVTRRSHSLFSRSHSLFLRSHSLYCAATAYPVQTHFQV